ncbi:MAG: MAE_28990/MAE_18760 family HEPN-like nuclease [Burkholderiales bacterium]|nr:MAE_28990/MAE_18760 family HEPN-like nuclease [Burkholderiales bacterium]
MISVKAELSEKKEEANLLLELTEEVGRLENGVVKAAILKSTFILLLYNMIESTMSMIFERIHERLSSEHYVDLSPQLKSVWVEFFFEKSSPTNYKSHLDKTLAKTLEFPNLEVFTKRVKLFSGNLDSGKLHGLLTKYGVGILATEGKEKLVFIKNKRNKVAHGEESFTDSCRHLTHTELLENRNSVFLALDSIVEQADDYLSNRKYSITPLNTPE